MIGNISSIDTMGLVDGPGIRVVVFMQGCALRCLYCHNPDTWTLDGNKDALDFTPEELVKKMEKNGAKAYLVNTGWNGTGKRISIKDTRGIIDAILNGSIKQAPTKTIPHFDFEVPTALPGVDPKILDPRDTYADASEWETKALDLAERFIKNFAKYEGNAAGKALVSAGPQK